MQLSGALSAKILKYLPTEAEISGGHSSSLGAALLPDNKSAIFPRHVTKADYKTVMFAHHGVISAFHKRLKNEPDTNKGQFKFMHYVVIFDPSVK